MSDAFYNKMARTAAKLLGKFGKEFVIVREVGRSVDNITGVVTPGTITNFRPKGMIVEYTTAEKMDSRIEQGDRKLILDNTVEPLMTDRPTVDGKKWTIKEIEKSEPAGIPLVYFVRVSA